ncbi:MAG: hypothetical protein AB1449_10075 [Chloroflexota bacterium]
MNLLDIANSVAGPPVGMALARLLPARIAYRLADRGAEATARRRGLPIVEAIRANQAVVRGLPLDDPSLEAATEAVLVHAARGYVDLFRALAHGQQALIAGCTMMPDLQQALVQGRSDGRGMLAVSGHLSCFDMLVLTLAARGVAVQGLSYADPRGSYRVQNILRRRSGLILTPISQAALRMAFARLRRGELVLTGVDRPAPEGEMLRFFGRLARMPVGHARLAIRTRARILVGAMRSAGQGHYEAVYLGMIDPLEMGREGGDPRAVAEAVLALLESPIRARPEEWLMFFPVWPEVLQG